MIGNSGKSLERSQASRKSAVLTDGDLSWCLALPFATASVALEPL